MLFIGTAHAGFVMKRLFAIPFVSALLGAGVAVAVIAAFGGLDNTQHVTTTIQAAPLQPSNASQQTPQLTPHDIYVRDAPGVVSIDLQALVVPVPVTGGARPASPRNARRRAGDSGPA